MVNRKKKISLAEHIEEKKKENLGLRDFMERRNLSRLEGREGRERLGRNLKSEVEDQVAEIQREQKTFGEKLEIIQEQNKQMLQLLKGLSQESNEADITLPSRRKDAGDTLSGPKSSMAEDHLKYYKESSFSLYLRKRGQKCSFWTSSNSERELGILADLVDWLEMALGGRGFTTSSSLLSGCIRLEDDNAIFFGEGVHPSSNPAKAQGCWRKKVISGNILGPPLSIATAAPGKTAGGISLGIQPFPHPFSESKDGLALTMAALWSLFDNAVERMPHCNCTFKTKSGDFIQCKKKIGKWYLWHTFSDEKPCGGKQCESNVCVALTATEPGERIYTTSPCVLGWATQGRTKPDSPIWNTLPVTSDFRKKTFTKYDLTEVQALGQLTIPAIVSPQIGAGITFSKRFYEVANSIDHASKLAMGIAAATVVLIFDERRGLHIACDGADIIEMLCLQLLKNLGHNSSYLPPFAHPTALQRLDTWYQSSFVTPTGTYITGDCLVREASKRISELVWHTKTASKRDKALLYWPLEDILRGNAGKALKAPRIENVSWHELAFEYPPLILVVGDVDAKLITATGCSLKLKTSDSKSNTASQFISNMKQLVTPHPARGGIVGSHCNIERWFLQAGSFYKASLGETENQVVFGDQDTDSECTYRMARCSEGGTFPDSPFASCRDCQQNGSQRCLHYIQ